MRQRQGVAMHLSDRSADVGLREVVTLEQQCRAQAAGERI